MIKMKLTPKKRILLRIFVDYKCENCHKDEQEVGTLEVHRIKPKGEYSLNNIKMLCKNCHSLISSALRKAYGIQ
jgi:5-methylcytosine-specific restriction endonuclease McrA